MSLWPYWLRPEWLILSPLLLLLLYKLWRREKHTGRWQQLLPVQFHAALLSAGRRQQSRLPWLALALAWLLALGALLGPSWQRIEQVSQKRSDPLVVVLELTPNMLAGDLAPNRLEQAKRKVRDLLNSRHDGQTAIIVYAGSAHVLVPLSDDVSTSDNLLDTLKPSIMPRQGQRADLAIKRALELLKQGAQGSGQILLISSGLNQAEQQGIEQALSGQNTRFNLLAVGSTQGAPIRNEDGSLSKDADGAIMIPKLNSTELARFTHEVGGKYQHLQLGDDDLSQLGLLNTPTQMRDAGEPTLLDAWADQGHWLLIPLVLIAACAARRGWLFGLVLLLGLPQYSYAMSWNDLWLRPDQQGQRLLEQNRPLEAAKHFDDPQWQGEAFYQGGNYAAAAERFTLSDSAAGHYNRGNALAQMQAFEAALDAYDQALERQPNLQPALANKALVEELLRQQKEQEQQQAQQNARDEQQTANSNDASEPGSNDANQQPSQAAGQPTETAESDPSAAGESHSESPSDNHSAQHSASDSQQGQEAPGNHNSAENANDIHAASHQPAQAQASQTTGDADGAQGDEQRAAMEQWLRQIPDDPGELLRRKFLFEQRQQQERQP